MLRNILTIIIFLVVCVPAIARSYGYSFQVQGKNILLEEANTLIKKRQGLMYRSCLKKHTGMLFTYDVPSEQGFWMKNVKFPLDIIFIKDRKIVKIYKNVQPCRCNPCPIYHSKESVNKVIEVNAGFCDKYRIKEGDTIKLREL